MISKPAKSITNMAAWNESPTDAALVIVPSPKAIP
jgi:hypothetical protein